MEIALRCVVGCKCNERLRRLRRNEVGADEDEDDSLATLPINSNEWPAALAGSIWFR